VGAVRAPVLDTEDAHLFLGGSSSRLLSTEVATTFRGRGFVVEVLPFGFREYVRALGHEPQGLLSQADRSRLAALADAYLVEGGFPELVGASGFARTQTLQSYVEMVVLKDVVERFGAENIAALKHLVSGAFAANASQFSVSSLEGALRSQGFRTSKSTLLTYLDHLVEAFLLFLVPIDSRSAKARAVNPRKVYAIDTGLAAAMHASGALNRGALLENAVYLELRRRLGPLSDGAIAYHRTASGREIDFVIDSPVSGGGREFVQVCASLEGAAAIERETAAVAEALISAEGSTATIVTRTESGELQTDAGVVRVVPFWEWALEGTPVGS
jgi:predicted AAA+ superfamily ATPase